MNDGWTIPGGGNSFPFDNPQDWVKITVTEFEPNLKVTDQKTGEQKFFKSGDPILMHRIGGKVLESSNPAFAAGAPADVMMAGAAKCTVPDQGHGSKNAAIAAAIRKATGGNQLMPNSTLTVQYIGDEPDTPRGQSPTKRYAAWYVPPALGAVGPTGPDGMQPGGSTNAAPAAAATPVPPGAPASTGALASPVSATPAPAATAFLTPEQQTAVNAALAAAQAPAWDADPRVAPLRAQGLTDAIIRQVLGI